MIRWKKGGGEDRRLMDCTYFLSALCFSEESSLILSLKTSAYRSLMIRSCQYAEMSSLVCVMRVGTRCDTIPSLISRSAAETKSIGGQRMIGSRCSFRTFSTRWCNNQFDNPPFGS